jgi:hypothetical protein
MSTGKIKKPGEKDKIFISVEDFKNYLLESIEKFNGNYIEKIKIADFHEKITLTSNHIITMTKVGAELSNISSKFGINIIFDLNKYIGDTNSKLVVNGGGMSFNEFVSTFNGWKSDINGGRTGQIDIVKLIHNVYIALTQGWIELAYRKGGNYMVKARKYTTKPKSVTKSSSKKPVKKQAKATVNKK